MSFTDQFIDSGKLENVDAILSGAKFYVDDNYADGTSLFLEVDVSPADDEDFDTDTIRWKVGNIETWEVAEDGLTIENVVRPGKWFNNKSQMGRLMYAIGEVEELADFLESRGTTPADASFYDNLVVTLGIDTEEFTLDDGDVVKSIIQIPTAFIREHGEKKAAKKAAPKKKAAAAKSTNDQGLSAKEQAAFDKLAGDCDDMDEFQTRAYAEVDGIEDSEVMQTFVDDLAVEYYA